MEGTQQLKLNEPGVLCQVMEGDAVLVHFESGLYYSARGTGADVCALLMGGLPVQQVIEALAHHHHREISTIEPEVHAFVERLLWERLFVPVPHSAPANAATASIASASYQTPLVEVFDDMADQLLLDKIEDETREAWVNPTDM